jgi:hypothetical protein
MKEKRATRMVISNAKNENNEQKPTIYQFENE